MWFSISSMAILFVSYTQQETLRQFPQNVNMVLHPERPDQHFHNMDENSPFHLHVFDDDVPNEVNKRGLPFIMQRNIRTHKEYTCGCEVQLNYIDLGYEHVPRYLTTASCKLEKCILGHCKPVYYQVAVLRKKKPEDIDSSSSLPLELSDNFVREIRNITIDCQCKY